MNRPNLPDYLRAALCVSLLSCTAVASAQTPATVVASGNPVQPVGLATVAQLPEVSEAGTSQEGTSVEEKASAPAAAPTADDAALPDAPSSTSLRASAPDSLLFLPPGQAAPSVAPKLTKYIPAGWTAQPLTAHDKVLVGLKDLYSPLNFLAMIASSGYEQLLNGEPNYGTDRGAFGQRLGAAAIRESSQGLFTDSVFSPLFREDLRYYVQGQGHSFLYRASYAATRPLITRTDKGNSTINAGLLAGYASSSALAYAYYPQINRNFHDIASAFGGSLGGAALGFAVSEFSDDIFKALHLRKK